MDESLNPLNQQLNEKEIFGYKFLFENLIQFSFHLNFISFKK